MLGRLQPIAGGRERQGKAHTAVKKTNPNPWLDAAREFGLANDSFVALDPRTNPKSWAAWREYFRWLSWTPFWFAEVERLHEVSAESKASWTAPIDHPDKFTCQFRPATPRPNGGVSNPEVPGDRANLFVGYDKPGYQAMIDRAKSADAADWCWYKNHPKWGNGIKVPLTWWNAWKSAAREAAP